jgi:outer membrane receptor for ferrienterochelin and colicin
MKRVIQKISRQVKIYLQLSMMVLLFCQQATAQQSIGAVEVTGTVLSEKGDFLPGVTVEARTAGEKEPVSVLTDVRGVFLFRHLQSGKKYDFTFKGLGYETGYYKSYTVKEMGQKNTLLVKLKENNNQLDEVVVTGQGLSVSKRRISTNVTTISGKQLRDLPANRLDQLLQAQVPNAQFKLAGGQAGATSIIQTRGFNSAFANSTPIIYVDGVRVDNLNTAPTVGMNLSGGISQGASTSSIADIPLENIERIEFVNGGAATTLYGSDAANGVLQIFTKKRGGGKANFYAGVDLGLEKATNDYLYFKRTKDLLFKDGFYNKYSLGADGGNEEMGFSLGGSYSKSTGTLIYNQNEIEKLDFKTGLYAKVVKGLTYEGTFSYNNQSLKRVRNGNSGGYSGLWFAEDGASKITGPGFNPRLDDLSAADFARVKSFVDSAEMLQNNSSKVNRFQTSQVLKYQPVKNLQVKGTFGIDYRTQSEMSAVSQTYNRHIRSNATGSLSKYDRNYLGITLELTGQYDAKVGDFSFLTTAGGQLFRNEDHQIGYIGQDIWDGAQTIDPAATKTSAEFYARVANYGLFVQENIGFKNRYFLDLGIRGDGNSAFGSSIGTQYYPKAGVSYILSAEPFFANWNQHVLSTVKIRANYGVAGTFPTPFANDRTVYFNGFNGSKSSTFGLPGNNDLRPEKSYSKEAGIDMGLWRDRLTVTVTYFDNLTKDALFRVPPAASTGRENMLKNLGEISNKGWEFAVAATVIQKQDLDVKVRASANTVENVVVSTGGAPFFNLSGMTSRTVQTVVREGFPVGYISGNYGVFNADGTWSTSVPQSFLGSTIPTLTGSMGLNVRYKRLSLFGNADYQQGGYLGNWDKQFRINYGASTDGVPAAEIAKNGPKNWLDYSQFFVQKSDFIKIRTLGILYDVDKSLIGNHISRLTLGFTAVNPFNFVASESDPEAVMPGGAQGQGTATTGGLNYASYSAPRQFLFSAKINF